MAYKNLNLLVVICLLLISLVARSSTAFFQHAFDQDELSAPTFVLMHTAAPAEISASQNGKIPPDPYSSQGAPAQGSEHCIVHCHIIIGVVPSHLFLNPPQGFEHRFKLTTASFSSRSQDPDLRPPIV